jgi:hypothetical protein
VALLVITWRFAEGAGPCGREELAAKKEANERSYTTTLSTRLSRKRYILYRMQMQHIYVSLDKLAMYMHNLSNIIKTNIDVFCIYKDRRCICM